MSVLLLKKIKIFSPLYRETLNHTYVLDAMATTKTVM